MLNALDVANAGAQFAQWEAAAGRTIPSAVAAIANLRIKKQEEQDRHSHNSCARGHGQDWCGRVEDRHLNSGDWHGSNRDVNASGGYGNDGDSHNHGHGRDGNSYNMKACIWPPKYSKFILCE